MSNDILPLNSSINDSYRNYYQESEESLKKLESISSKTEDLSYQFVKEFFKQSNKPVFKELEMSNSLRLENLAKKIQTLSNKKIDYYQKSKFGFITEFFSKLRNLVTLHQFISSGELGKQLAEKTLKKLGENYLNAIDSSLFQEEIVTTTSNANPTTITEVPLQEELEVIDANSVDIEELEENYLNAIHPSLFQEEIVTTNLNEVDVENNDIDDDDDDDVFYDAVEEIQPEKPKQILDDLNNNQPIPKDVKTLDNVVDETDPENISDSEVDDDGIEEDDSEYKDAFTDFLEPLSNTGNLENSTDVFKSDKLDDLESTTAHLAVESGILTKPDYLVEMFLTFSNIWQNAPDEQKLKIQRIGIAVFGKTLVEKWKKKEEGFQLTLEKEMAGKNNSNNGKVTIKKLMLIQFVEEENARSNGYIQKIIFPDEGLATDILIGKGFVSKLVNVKISSIAFEGNEVTIDAHKGHISQKKTISFEEAMSTWEDVTWE
jgi:hypothetical protein